MTASRDAPDLRAPFLIGVTGHRHLDAAQVPRLRQEVGRLVERLRARMPHTPLVLVNALAEGADLLVAEVAIEHGIELLVPLPMELERYAATFDDPEAAARMREHAHGGAARRLVLGADGEDDAACFQRLQVFLARHAHLLVALWDGASGRGDGGTADVVAMARSADRIPGARELDRQRRLEVRRTPPLPVWWIPTTRAGEASTPKARDTTARFLPPRVDDPAEPTPQAGALARFTAEWSDLDAWNRACAGESPADRPWQARFDALDRFAITQQTATRRLFMLRLGLVVAAFLLLELAAGPARGNPLASLGSLVCLAVGTLGLARANRRCDRRYLTSRALAEHLRVLVHLPALRRGEDSGVDHLGHLRLVGPPADPLCRVLDAWTLTERLDGASPEARPVANSLQEWVDDQAAYFARARRKESRREAAWARATRALVLLGLGGALALALSFLPGLRDALAAWRSEIALASTAALLLAAACRAVRAYRAYQPNANRYELAERRFRAAAADARDALAAGDEDEARACLHELADLALRENSEWLGLHLDRPPNPEI